MRKCLTASGEWQAEYTGWSSPDNRLRVITPVITRSSLCSKWAIEYHNETKGRAQRVQTSTKASNLNQLEWSGIQIRISRFASGCRGVIILSASVISSSAVKIGRLKYMRNANKSSKSPYSSTGEGSGKATRNPYPRPDILPIRRSNHDTKFKWNRLIIKPPLARARAA